MGSKNKASFKEWVKNWGSNVSVNPTSIEEETSSFFQQLQDGYDVCFPPQKVKLKKIDLEKPWLNNNIILSKIKERNRLYTISLKRPEHTQIHQERLKKLTQEVKDLRKNLKKRFFAQKLQEAGNNSKSAWNIIHRFIGKAVVTENTCNTFFKDGERISDDSDIAESFCTFYSSIALDTIDMSERYATWERLLYKNAISSIGKTTLKLGKPLKASQEINRLRQERKEMKRMYRAETDPIRKKETVRKYIAKQKEIKEQAI